MATPYSFARISDGALISFFRDLMKDHEDAVATFAPAAAAAFNISHDKVLAKPWAKVLNSESYLIASASLSIPTLPFTVQFQRGKVYTHNPQSGGYSWLPATSEYIDGINVDGTPQEHSLQLLSVIGQHLKMAPPIALTDGGASALAQSAGILNRVSEAVADLTRHTSERQKDLDETRASMAAETEKTLKVRENDLKARYKLKQEELAKTETALNARASELDDRENTHVRRELQKSMATLSDTNLAKNLLNRSLLPFMIPIILVSVSVLLVAYFISGEIENINAVNKSIQATASSTMISNGARPLLIKNLNDTILFSQLRIALQTLGAAALVWFALRLASSRYKQVSKWEHDLHRFRLDTERAGFLIEGDLEARKVNEQGLPEVMLDRFSRGLFAAGSDGHNDSNDDLGSTLSLLLGRAAGVKVGPNGVEVNIDKSGLKKARKEIGDTSEAD